MRLNRSKKRQDLPGSQQTEKTTQFRKKFTKGMRINSQHESERSAEKLTDGEIEKNKTHSH